MYSLKKLPELEELKDVLSCFRSHGKIETIAEVKHGDLTFPLITMVLGSSDRSAPVVGLFAGVHGLERIGTRVILSYLRTLSEFLRWDSVTQSLFDKIRLVVMPLINPAGMYLQRRSNANGVDLMRNSPTCAEGISRFHLFSGHRISPKLPWYQGLEGAPMQVESQAVCDFVRREVFSSRLALTVDVHSGYGTRDRFWFPYAKTKLPFPNIAEVLALKHLLDSTYPNHVYWVEPQSKQYVTHGDLWDYLYDEYRAQNPDGIFIPFSLELGSWLWVKKNIRQAFSLLGVFNPLKPHRLQRILRRHLALFYFLERVVLAPSMWCSFSSVKTEALQQEARKLWYAG